MDAHVARDRSDEVRALVGVALVSGAVIVFELALLRIFSFTIWHHFAFMVISVALLGFGGSGIVLGRFPRLASPAIPQAARFASGFSATSIAAAVLCAHLDLEPARAVADPEHTVVLLVVYLSLALAFGFAGASVIVLLRHAGPRAGRTYAADLAGAGLFGVVALPLLGVVGADGLVFVASALAALAAAVLAPPVGRGHAFRRLRRWSVASLLVLIGCTPFASHLLPFRPGPSKGLAELLDHRIARVASTTWSPIARVDAVEGRIRVGWTSNRRKGTSAPPAPALVLDGDASTPISRLPTTDDEARYLDFTLSSAAPQLVRPANVLVLGSGGGVDVATALHHGARHVDAVELNEAVRRLVTGRYAAATDGLFLRRDVTLHAAEGRSFVHASTKRWDLVQISLIDTWAASAAGAYAMSEGYLYTTEAFVDYLEHLTDDGALAVTRWQWPIPRESMRLVTVAADALERTGARDPSQHIVVLAVDRLVQVLVRRSPFDTDDVVALRSLADRRGFRIEYAPGDRAGPYASYLHAPDRERFLATYPYDVRATTDDAPFFFQFARGLDSTATGDSEDATGTLSGRGVLAIVLAQASFVTFVFLVLPSLRRRIAPAAATRSRVLVYFFAIGISFMLVEMSLMQRFTLYLGHPLYAFACVLLAILWSAAAGSLASRRFGARTDALFVAIMAAVLTCAYGLPLLFATTIGEPLLERIAIGACAIAPVGFLLGVPMPLALARIPSGDDETLSARAWAANGCGSVIGPILAPLLAFDLGFTQVTLLAAVGYGVAYFARPV